MELVNLIWLREVSLNGMVKLGMNVNEEFWKKHIREVGKHAWKDDANDTEREKEYVRMKECPSNESFCGWKCGCRNDTDGEGRISASAEGVNG